MWAANTFAPWNSQRVIQHDVNSYYSYLPALFIHGDLSFEFVEQLPADFNGDIWVQQSPEGGLVGKMPIGCAVMYMPFFLAVHADALLVLDQPTGYDPIYHFSLSLAAIIYALLAAIFLRKILLRFFSEVVSGVVIITVFLSTNLFYYTVVEPGMSHVYSFFLVVMLVKHTMQWEESGSLKDIIWMAFAFGLLVLVRPTNGIFVLFPVVLVLGGRKSAKEIPQWLLAHKMQIIIAAILSIAIISFQLAYWKFATGKWIYYSYGEEGFYFNNPHIFEGLLGFRKGFFIYTPIMLFAAVGLMMMYRSHRKLFWPILVVVGIHIYIVYSWWCWWYGGSFGARPMIETYALLALPLGVFLSKVFSKGRLAKAAILVVCGGLLWLNCFQTLQYRSSLLHWDGMTRRAYTGIFGSLVFPPNYNQLIDRPDYEKALKGEEEN